MDQLFSLIAFRQVRPKSFGRPPMRKEIKMNTVTNPEPGELENAPVCATCGSQDVVVDAWASWNPATAMWELEDCSDAAFCKACNGKTKLRWTGAGIEPGKRIQKLNDLWRTQGEGQGLVLITDGIASEGAEFARAALLAIRRFAEFSEDNDPWGQHDFGAVSIQGKKVFWKIDYYDQSLTTGSEDPGNEAVTHRVLTIMLAEEY